LRKISDHIEQQYGIKASYRTVHRWIIKYVSILETKVSSFVPRLSPKWHADETVQKVRGKRGYQWNLIDDKTRFFIATQVSMRRDANAATKLVENGMVAAKANPKTLITDGLSSYGVAVTKVKSKCSVRLKHRKNAHIPQNNRVERLNNTLRERTKIMRGLKGMRSAQRFAESYRFYYNFIRPHEGLDGRTPAEAAGFSKGLNKWRRLLDS